MSQVAAVSGASGATTASAAASTAAMRSSELDDIREYEKIIKFRDTVVSGKHPRIKVPVPSVVKNASTFASHPSSGLSERVTPSSAQAPAHNGVNNAVNGHSAANMLSFRANSQQQPAVTMPPSSSTPFIPGVSKPFSAGKPEIDPVLLQKSDGLVKAELTIQRQRLEKAIKDQVDQRRSCVKSSLQSEQLSDLDISDIFAKALTLVQATAPPPASVFHSPDANASEPSDSFDENTFYSSQPDTPGRSLPTASPRHTVGNVHVQGASTTAVPPTGSGVPSSQPLTPFVPPLPISRPPQTTGDARQIPQIPTIDAQNVLAPLGVTAPMQGQGIVTTAAPAVPSSANQGYWSGHTGSRVNSFDSRGASRPDNSGNTDPDPSADHRRVQNPPPFSMPNPSFRQPEEPLIRGHNLSPFAPQPAHVSPLALARQSDLRDSDSHAMRRVPPQITALRQEDTSVMISPDSSPQGDKSSKKKSKKKKRKVDTKAQDGHVSPVIKEEPRSPSPFTASAYMRPPKRPRHSGGRPEPDFRYDEAITAPPAPQPQQDRRPLTPVHIETVPVETVPQDYERADDRYARQVRASVAPVARRPPSPLYEERRPDGSIVRYVRRVRSPLGYAEHYDADIDARAPRTTSYTVANPDLRDAPIHPRDSRMSVRPYADRARSRSPTLVDLRALDMPPPSALPHRLMVDEYGREYLEPVPTALSRRSVVPSMRAGDQEVIYERASVRPASRLPAAEIVGEDGAIYRRISPGYPTRYGTEFRSYRERDYPTQSMGPPSSEFVQLRGATEHRIPEHMPREYFPRAASVRPVGPVEMAYDRLSSSRPDIPPRRYASSVHPEARREVAPHLIRDYNDRPAEMSMPQRAFSVRPVERYYEPPREGDVAYIERPRAVQQESVYPGNGGSQRSMYQ